jgi:GTP-binding protein
LSIPTVAIIGRVNVGKSALFNRLVGGSRAIVDDAPGVTRDRNISVANWTGHDFYVVDTGGLVPGSEDVIQSAVERQVRLALSEADAVILVVDGMSGIHPFDEAAADLVRRSGIPAFLAVNKMDNLAREAGAAEFFSLGLGFPYPVSALHGSGSGDLLDAVVSVLPAVEHTDAGAVPLAIVGRPNVGKSSLVNRICGFERNVVAPTPGTTRDATDTLVEWQGHRFRLVDTAGLRRRSRSMEDLEFYSTLRSWRTIDRAEVVLVLVDGTEIPSQQDLRIAGRAWELGKGLIVGVNKIDLEVDRKAWLEEFLERFHPGRWVQVIFLSALKGTGVGRVLPTAWQIAEGRGVELSTPEVNKWLESAVDEVQPPSPRGRPLRFFYATQTGRKPPRLLIFCNRPEDIPENYKRYLENGLRDMLGLRGIPLKISFRKREH